MRLGFQSHYISLVWMSLVNQWGGRFISNILKQRYIATRASKYKHGSASLVCNTGIRECGVL